MQNPESNRAKGKTFRAFLKVALALSEGNDITVITSTQQAAEALAYRVHKLLTNQIDLTGVLYIKSKNTIQFDEATATFVGALVPEKVYSNYKPDLIIIDDC